MATRISWNNVDQIEALKDQLGAVCGRVTELSKERSPPGVNAANGFFRDAMVNDQTLGELLSDRNHYTDQEVAELYRVSSTFMNGIRGAFSPGNHEASVATSPGAFVKALEEFFPKVGTIVGELVAVYVADPAQKAVAIAAVEKDIRELIDAVKAKKVVFKGAHANGWIAPNVHGVATQFEAALQGIKPASSEGQKYVEAVKIIATKIKEIPLDNFEPWLNSDWQLNFQAVMEGGHKSLTAN